MAQPDVPLTGDKEVVRGLTQPGRATFFGHEIFSTLTLSSADSRRKGSCQFPAKESAQVLVWLTA